MPCQWPKSPVTSRWGCAGNITLVRVAQAARGAQAPRAGFRAPAPPELQLNPTRAMGDPAGARARSSSGFGLESGGGVFGTGMVLGRRARAPNEGRSGQVRCYVTRPKSRTRESKEGSFKLGYLSRAVSSYFNLATLEYSRWHDRANHQTSRKTATICRKQLTC